MERGEGGWLCGQLAADWVLLVSQAGGIGFINQQGGGCGNLDKESPKRKSVGGNGQHAVIGTANGRGWERATYVLNLHLQDGHAQHALFGTNSTQEN